MLVVMTRTVLKYKTINCCQLSRKLIACIPLLSHIILHDNCSFYLVLFFYYQVAIATLILEKNKLIKRIVFFCVLLTCSHVYAVRFKTLPDVFLF